MVFWSEDVDCIRLRVRWWQPQGWSLFCAVTFAMDLLAAFGVANLPFGGLFLGFMELLVVLGMASALLSALLCFRDQFHSEWIELDLHGGRARWTDSPWEFVQQFCAVGGWFGARDGWEVRALLADGRILRVLGVWSGRRREVEALVRRLNELV